VKLIKEIGVMETNEVHLGGGGKSVKVDYIIKNEYGKFKEIYEEFQVHEDGDPMFVLPTDDYKKMIHAPHEKQMWKIVTTEGMQRFIMRNPGKDIWFVDEATGNTYKYLMPKKD
jgi:hypothetical protein